MQVMIALAGPIRFGVKAWTTGGGQTNSDGLVSGGSGASSDGRPAWPGLDGGGGGRAGLDGRAGFLFFYLLLFFCRMSENAPGNLFTVCQTKGTRQRTSLPTVVYRVRFAVCYTRQSLCRVFFGLCRVLLAHGKLDESRSESLTRMV